MGQRYISRIDVHFVNDVDVEGLVLDCQSEAVEDMGLVAFVAISDFLGRCKLSQQHWQIAFCIIRTNVSSP